MARINKQAKGRGRAKNRDVKVSATRATVPVKPDRKTRLEREPIAPAAVDRRKQILEG